MMKKVSAYLKKGFLMMLVAAMVCTGSGISALAAAPVVTEVAVDSEAVSDNSVPELQEKQQEEQQEVSVADDQESTVEEEFVSWETEEVVNEVTSDSTEVAYIYAEGTSNISGINLNGNSVIIKASENDDEGGQRLINLIIDKDRDGEIDDDEEMAQVDGSADVTGAVAIYGYYNTQATEPVSITLQNGCVYSIHGVYEGELETENETAITIRVLGGLIYNGIYGIENGQVTTSGATAISMVAEGATETGIANMKAVVNALAEVKNTTAPAVDMDVKAGTVSILYGCDRGALRAETAANTVLDMDVTGEGKVSAQLCGIMGNDINSLVSVRGGVDIDYCPSTGTESVNVNSFYGAYYAALDGNLDVQLKGTYGTAGVYGAYYSSISGNVNFDVPKGNVLTSSLYGMNYSSCQGDLKVTVSASEKENTKTSNVYGFYDRFPNATYVVGGDFVFDYLGGISSYVYGGYGNRYNDYALIKGNADIRVLEGTIQTFEAIYYWVQVEKDVTVTVGDYTTDLTEEDSEPIPCSITSNIYMLYNAKVNGSTSLRIRNTNTDSNRAYLYGTYYCDLAEDVIFDVDGGYYSNIQAIYHTKVGGDVTLNIRDVNKDYENLSNLGTSYGVYYESVAGDTHITASDSNFGTFYGTYSSPHIGNVTVNCSNCKANNSFYGTYSSTVEGSLSSTLNNVSAGTVYGAYLNGGPKEGLSVSMTDVTATGTMYGFDGNSSGAPIEGDATITFLRCSSKAFIAFEETPVLGNLKVDIQESTFGSETGYNTVSFASPSYVKGTTTITATHVTTYGNTYPYNVWTSNSYGINGDATITLKDVDVNSGASNSFYVGSGNGQKVEATLDSDCTISEDFSITPSGGGEVIVTTPDSKYYGGKFKITEDTTLANVHLAGGSIYIPTGVTLTCDAFYFEGGSLLLQGTLDATIMNEVTDAGVYENSVIYMWGGTLSDDVGKIDRVYYPLDVEYKEKGGTVTASGTRPMAHDQSGTQKFFKAGDQASYTISVNEGYSLGEVTYQGENDEAPLTVPLSNAKYVFTMPMQACTFRAELKGNQIVVGKTVKDPIAKVNVETTAEEPLYDLATLSVSNDGLEGEVTYAVDSTYKLPQGLTMSDGKIYGTPTVVNESGTKTIIHVTGKNDTSVEVPLNIVVTAGEGKQDNQEGRITVDDVNKIIYASGNSVILEVQDNRTAIYLDDDRDGVADYATPACVGDYTEYVLYGIRNTDTSSPIRITMNGGTIGSIYGASNGDITAEGFSLEIYVKAGSSVGTVKSLESAKVTGLVKVIIDKEATATYVNPTNHGFAGYYYDDKGYANANGTYDFTEDIAVDELWLVGKHVIPEGVTVTTNKLVKYDTSETKLRGTLNATQNIWGYSGKVFMQGGNLSGDASWNYIYYPLTMSSNMEKATVRATYNHRDLTEDGVKTTYGWVGESVKINITNIPGYDFYYSVNGEENVKTELTEFSVTMPEKNTNIVVTYVPRQIVIEKNIADPIGKIGETYTAQNPLYDLRSLTLTDDTSVTYGGEVKYVLKNENSLPEGLSFENGRIIGTPVNENMTGVTLSFVVTGRNGTTETVDVTVKIADEDYEYKDINDFVTVNGQKIELNGTSVVVLPSPTASNYSQIFIDENRDGLADNNNPLVINGNTSYALVYHTIYGYTNTSSPYNGDIRITVKGGKLNAIYGAGSDTYSKATVNGNVMVDLQNVTMEGTASGVYGARKAIVNNLTLSVTGGSYQYTEFYGAIDTQVKDDLNFTMGERMIARSQDNRNDKYKVFVYVSSGTDIEGDVNATLGFENELYGFRDYSDRYSTFYGVFTSNVTGSVNYDMKGYWQSGYVYLVRDSDVQTDVDIDIADGATFLSYYDYVYVGYVGANVAGELRIDVPENAAVEFDQTKVLHNSTAKDLAIHIPKSAKKGISLEILADNSATVTGNWFVNKQGIAEVGGSYTIAQDMEFESLTLRAGANVSIAKDVTVKTTYQKLIIPSGATLTNKGTLDSYVGVTGYGSGIGGTLVNEGYLKTSGAPTTNSRYPYYFPILSAGQVINKAGAVWDVEGPMYNSGKIVNYGVFNQNYSGTAYFYIGTVFTTEQLNLSWTPATDTYYKSSYMSSSYPYPDIYYPVTVEYPEHCVADVTLSGDAVKQSGVAGDNRQYVRALYDNGTTQDKTPTFVVTPGEVLLDNIEVENVTYGPNQDLALENTSSWVGYAAGIFEPFTICVNYKAADEVTSSIELSKTEDSIRNTEEAQWLVVGKTYSESEPLYDLTKIEVSNDTQENGVVTYYVDLDSSLPSGLVLKNGKVCGTLKTATENDQKIIFVVKGKDQTSAFFTLTLGPVAKQVPTWSAPTNLQALVGEKLENVTGLYSSQGTYSWPDKEISVGDSVTMLENQTLWFTPNDTVNYDWATAATNAGATYENGKIVCEVDIQVCAGIPTYTVPDTIKATYGDTYADVSIPTGDNDGKFEWIYSPDVSVGNVGTYTRRVNYIPNDSNYQKVTNISITLIVEPAVGSYQKITSVSQECGSTLADILLPDVTGGKYQWITTTTTIPLDGKTYQVGFKPDDTTNYDWTKVDGWNEAWKCVVFPITVYLEHTYATVYEYDETHHWYPCIDETCDGVGEKDEHRWDAGTVLESATTEEEGLIEYSCICGASYEDTIPKLTHASHIYTGSWKFDEESHWKQCTHSGCVETAQLGDHDFDDGVIVSAPTATKKGVIKYTCRVCKYTTNDYLTQEEWIDEGWGEDSDGDEEKDELPKVGTKFTDKKSKASYKITVEGAEVAFVKPTKKTYTKVSIPKTVKYEGITYKVTSIANNACKSNKKLKTVVIGANVKTIGTKAFYGCTKLTKVTIGKNVTTIGNSAFQSCTTLKKITIPSKVSKIGSKAFYGCKKLTSMTIKTSKLTDKKVGKDAFKKMGSSNYKKVNVKVPKKKLSAYKKMLKKKGLSSKAKVKK